DAAVSRRLPGDAHPWIGFGAGVRAVSTRATDRAAPGAQVLRRPRRVARAVPPLRRRRRRLWAGRLLATIGRPRRVRAARPEPGCRHGRLGDGTLRWPQRLPGCRLVPGWRTQRPR